MGLFQEFDRCTKSEWINLVKKDLKGSDIRDLNFNLTKNLSRSPFYHQDDITEDIDTPIVQANGPFLGFQLKITNEQADNALIKEQLNGGVNYLSVDVGNMQSIDYNLLLKDVFSDMIIFHLSVGNNQEKLDNFIRYMNRLYDVRSLDNCRIINTGKLIHPFPGTSYIDGRKEPSGEHLLRVLLEEGKILMKDTNISDQVIFQMPFGHDYLLNICQVRAARLLWANLCEAIGVSHQDQSLFIEGWVSSSIIQEDHHANMIALSQIGVSMICSSVDVLHLPPSDIHRADHGSAFGRRIARNIFHLMNLEGNMGKVTDPAAGSYFFEKTSVDLAELAWHKFTE